MNSPDPVLEVENKFIVNDTSEQVGRYIDEICSDPNFLCSNRQMCATDTTIYTGIDNINKICSNIEKSNKCENEFAECMVSTENLFDEARNVVKTSFVNIIIPITGAFDNEGNQKFLRLPPLSGSKKPKSTDICNICACMNRFSTSPGSGGAINENSYTSPGQNICIYPAFIEHYYYPISIQNINTKLKNAPNVKIGKYNVVNSNIIHARSEEELLVPNLYDVLIKNGITPEISSSFILDKLYKNDQTKAKELKLHISGKNKENKTLVNNGIFYENITFFYVLLVLLIISLILILT